MRARARVCVRAHARARVFICVRVRVSRCVCARARALRCYAGVTTTSSPMPLGSHPASPRWHTVDNMCAAARGMSCAGARDSHPRVAERRLARPLLRATVCPSARSTAACQLAACSVTTCSMPTCSMPTCSMTTCSMTTVHRATVHRATAVLEAVLGHARTYPAVCDTPPLLCAAVCSSPLSVRQPRAHARARTRTHERTRARTHRRLCALDRF